MTSLNELFTLQNSEGQKVIIYGEVPWAGEPEVVFIPKHWTEIFVALLTSKTWGELSSRIGTEKVHFLYLYSLEGYDEEEVAEGLFPKPNSSKPFSFEELIHSWDERPDPRGVSLVRAWLPEELIVLRAHGLAMNCWLQLWRRSLSFWWISSANREQRAFPNTNLILRTTFPRCGTMHQ